MSRAAFIEMLDSSVLSLPSDLKSLLRVVEDADVDDDGRVMGAGAILFTLSGQNAIPGVRGTLRFIDDVLVLRLVLERLRKSSPEALAEHAEDSPELFGELDAELAIAREYLGECMKVLDKAVDGVSKLQFRGHNSKGCVHDEDSSRWLYDAVNEALVEELDFDEDEVARELKQVDQILTHLRSRVASMNA